MTTVVLTEEAALAGVRRHAPLLAEEAVRADRSATVPLASIEALRGDGLWSAAIPAEFGGHGLAAPALTRVAAALAGHCAATAMIWAMHQLQVACLARGAAGQPELADYLAEAARKQHLVASVTSEADVGGNLRTSKAAAVRTGETVHFEKEATTISYASAADSFLVTMRRDPSASMSDQVLVLARRAEVTLDRTSGWNTLGMRGTESPGHLIRGSVPAGNVFAEPFGAIATHCMVPLSHLLWAAVWTGIAGDAVRRAARMTKAKARRGAPVDGRLAEAYAELALLQDAVRQFAAADFAHEAGLTPRANALKTSVSTGASRVVERCLEICGMPGFSEEGPFSVARHLRDLYSARLMVSNHQINAANSTMLLLGEKVFEL